MVDVDGMVSRLMQLMKYPDLSASLCSSRENSIAELLFRYDLRTAECEKNSAAFYLLKAFHIQASIAL